MLWILAFGVALGGLGGWMVWSVARGAGWYEMTAEEREEFHRGGGL